MNTPTDDEIVAHIRAQNNITTIDAYIRTALRLAREGLPVKDEKAEARDIWLWALAAYRAIPDMSAGDQLIAMDDAAEVIHKALAKRDAERDADVAELVKAASYARICLKNGGYHNEWTRNLDAALAKLERKP